MKSKRLPRVVLMLFCRVRMICLTLTRKVAVAEWSNMDNAQLRDILEKGQILFQEDFAQVIGFECIGMCCA